MGAGLHVIGYAHDPQYEITTTTLLASIAVPVIVFMIVRYLLQAWLVSALPRHARLELAATLVQVIGIALASSGAPVWACLLFVLASPVWNILAFELGGWRTLETQLGRVTDDAGRRSP